MRVRRPASLRGRLVAIFLAVLVAVLAGLFTTVDLVLAARLHSDLRTRLTDRVALADQLDGALSPQQLVDRLRGDGVAAVLCSPGTSGSTGGCVHADSTPPPPGARRAPTGGPAGRAAPAPVAPVKVPTRVQDSGSVLYVRTTLPSSGQQLTLSVDSSAVSGIVQRLVWLEVVGGAVTVLVVSLVVFRLVGAGLRPLDRMTALARHIASGDRGRRLRAGREDTELGRTAAAFDAMLDELESALAAASAAEERQRQFLDDASHELRTPVAATAATVETLLRDEPDRAGRESAYVRLIRESRRTARLVDDLLTVTRLENGQPLDLDDTDLAELVTHEVQRTTDAGARVVQRGLRPAPVHADQVRVAQVLTNLVRNAVRAAGPDGVVTVDVQRCDRTWVVDVLDDGPGVPPGDRERIFERLVRLDAARAADTGGFGLGLPIARSLARAHGGDVTCEDPPEGRGALFRLRLPAPADVREPTRAGAPAYLPWPTNSDIES